MNLTNLAMITKKNVSKFLFIVIYGYFLYLVILIYRKELNNVLSNDYILMKNVKIDSIYSVKMASGPKGDALFINFKDSGKTVNFILERNTPIQKRLVGQLFTDNVRTFNLVKREKSKSFFPQNTTYFTYDNRFICDSNGKCDFTEENKNKRILYLSLGFLIFIGIHYGVYRFYKNKKAKSLEE